MENKSCLAEGLVVSTDMGKTGINANELIVGSTGCGKTTSICCPRMLHTYTESIICPISKAAIRDEYSPLFEERGYKIMDIDFAHPEKSEVGYDPLHYVKREEDVMQLAEVIISGSGEDNRNRGEKYWEDSGSSVIAALIHLEIQNAKSENRRPSLQNVKKINDAMKQTKEGNSLDVLFEKAEREEPGCPAYRCWRVLDDLAERTYSCVMSIVNAAINTLISNNVIAMCDKDKMLDIEKIGKEKTVLFIQTSPMVESLKTYVNILYYDVFRILFEEAESNDNSRLDVPVHVICDDFACGSRIEGFHRYISIFRAAGISVTLLLQSESQLVSMYGENAAQTIIDNCDTYVYMGGNDVNTCQNVALRANKQTNTILDMPLEQVIVFRRGSKPYVGRRYQTYNDPIYKDLVRMNEKIKDKSMLSL